MCIRPALDDGPIGLADAAVLEQSPQMRERLAVPAEHEAPRSVAVEPMRQRRSARQAESQLVEAILEAGAALRAAVHRRSGRLVDHDHERVAVEHATLDPFRCHGETAITSRP